MLCALVMNLSGYENGKQALQVDAASCKVLMSFESGGVSEKVVVGYGFTACWNK